MRPERSSPSRIEVPQTEARREKETTTLRLALVRKGNAILNALDEPFHLEQTRGGVALGFDAEGEFKIKNYEGFDLDEISGDPSYRTETKRVGTLEYVVTERVVEKAGRASTIVRPDGHGAYPEADDLHAAMLHGVFISQRGAPEDIALVAHHYDRKSSKWFKAALEAVCAADSMRDPQEAARMVKTVINGLIEMHRKRVESL